MGSAILHVKKTLAAEAAALLVVTLAACGSSTPAHSSSLTQANTSASVHLTARDAFTKISAKVHSAKLSGVITAENDPNHLLGRPHQYTSKITFSDSRIAASDVSGTEKGDVDRGGSIEAFTDSADAKAREDYIQAIIKSIPALTEYDYRRETVLVRVSHYLTPKQAADYKAALSALG